jgi:hypothetical protein
MLVGKLRNRLLDAAKEYPHVKVLVVSEAFTTRKCGKCGVHNSTVGGAEVFKCRQRGCGYVCFRDLHAARIFLSSVSLSFWSVHFIADWCHQSLILPSVDALCCLVGTADPNPSPALSRRGVRRAVTGPVVIAILLSSLYSSLNLFLCVTLSLTHFLFSVLRSMFVRRAFYSGLPADAIGPAYSLDRQHVECRRSRTLSRHLSALRNATERTLFLMRTIAMCSNCDDDKRSSPTHSSKVDRCLPFYYHHHHHPPLHQLSFFLPIVYMYVWLFSVLCAAGMPCF